MAVILPTGVFTLSRREHPEADDPHGIATPGPRAAAEPVGSWPAAIVDRGNGTYSFRLDPAAWPVERDDILTDPEGNEYVVQAGPRMIRNTIDPTVDYIAGACVLDPPRRP